MIKLILVCSILGVFSVCVGQFIQNGQCDENIQLHENFDVDQFLGTWYENGRSANPFQGDCSTIELAREGDVITVVSRSVNKNFYEENNGTAAIVNNTAKLSLNLNSWNNPIDFWVLSTNYEDFALTYSCENVGTTQRRVQVWQLGRSTTYSSEMMVAFMNTTLVNLLGIDSSELYNIDHSERSCYRLPVIQPGQPIVLPEQCDPNITVVQNFDVARFLGVWHQVASYESENSRGACQRALYTLGDGVVNVVNSEVINQTLDTISGYASVISTDGSGRLNVVLEVAPGVFVDQELLVLATNYDDYAITYTCVNLPDNQKRVFSWIVSRSRVVSTAVQQQIDQVVDSYLELNYGYYQESDRSDEACFYYPEHVVDQPVVFRGQCNTTINAMPNFDPVRYMGLWHEIEKYPASFQDGTCNNAFYTLNGGVVDVYNTQVVNQTLDTINGFATIASTDGSAKLSVTFPIAGTNLTITTDYWVIDSDYDTYSLVYSCQNIDDDQHRVTSWILSRTKILPVASVTAINNAMALVPVIDQRYFQTSDQSTEGCFYYPTSQDGVPVVFPGQCDENIPVVQNFDLNQFQGSWYEVQAYPKDQQPGQCINHQFTVAEGNSLNLASSSVTDQFYGISNSFVNFTSTDNSAKFTITLSGTNIVFPYWILSIDYNDYALAYSCININNDFRGIWSWKLSRNKQLSAAATTAISNAIAPINVLDDIYYENIGQSDEDCFYLPDLAPGEPVIINGQCDPNITVVQNFDAARYLGRWLLIKSYPSDFQVGTCNDATYSLAADGSVIVYNTEVINQNLSTIYGSAVLASTDGSGKLLVTFPDVPVPIEYWIIDTDYDSYAVVYSCANINNEQRRVWSWIMSRNNTLSEAATNSVNQVIDSINVLNNRFYETIDRTYEGCFYYPTLNGNNPIIFRGQCDESINVVTNFQADRYMGLWHDIRSYPQPFQDGTCGNAFYTLVDGTVDVFNTQVVNQTLDTLNGVAVLATTDGSAKLLVTFPVQGFNVSTNYWVVGTDYDTYALIYSCQNIDSEYRQVSSWQLSRTKILPDAASQAITAITSTIDVLDDRYYLQRDQSVNGCFYYPEPQLGVPVVFPGQCDENLAAVQNFDLSLFQGIWYETEAYPKEEQQGQCISHQFTVAGNTLTMESNSVFGIDLNVTTGVVNFSSTDGSGRMTITFTSNGIVINIPYWILSTDYNNYALAYSCVNINSDFRGIWSWKLSRTKQLSAASATAIDNAISTINVLDNVYFETIDQSDEACFYLPNLAPGEPVVITGQCDPNIPVVQNFDAARYLGRWLLIESYPSEFQVGTCNDATYSLAADGSVIVYNTEVINQNLSTIYGSAVLATTDGTGKLTVTFPDVPGSIEYWILGTDYDSYAIIYSCVNITSEQRRVWSWKMSRDNALSENATTAINQVVNNINVLDNRFYETINRTYEGCFYYPALNGDNPIIFRGQCDESLSVVTNFQADRYMGLWHDIRSYPQPFQNGTCGNAFYTLVDGTVDVFNTQVLNQTLDTLNGVAVLATTDGSAKLLVTFPVQGFNITTNYWVLDTDYDTFALVYSCQNINSEYRQVSSWQLSRTKSLPIAASAAIAGITNGIDVLDDRYYLQRDQSADACFYNPEPQPGTPVVFPGQCDESLPAVPNFDLSQFQGLWHEIEAYPKIEQEGDCINHQFTVSGNTLNLQSSSISGIDLTLTTGNLAFTSNDNSGRFSITFTSNGTAITIPYWIMSTDYNNYALAYSCVNINSDYRGVWSWKLSRTKQLSAASTTAINNAISSINVLDNVYYETIDQSDEACFYLPNLAPGEPVIITGQCDPNIPVVQNFDAARYLGRWLLIESYPSAFQVGTCNDATYSLAADGSVIVYNTEVINQNLSTIYGSAVLATTDGSGKLTVTFPDAPEPIDYWILDTDYDSYTLVYSCVNINSEQRQVWSWIMSRNNTLSQASINAINQVVDSINVLDNRYYETIDRSPLGCFYYPTPDSSSPVLFRGQCNESISVVTNFQAERYLGLWHDIESYPAPFQDGSCSNALYTLNDDGTISVYNTQVVNQVLDTMSGTAFLIASADGSAKLSVTFNVGGVNVTTEYWVMDTDYDTYALVYSCQNFDEEYMQVFSWKLGRDKFLPPAAVTAINNKMDEVLVLSQQYYIQRGQTEEDCFFYPDNFGGDVLLDGQCEDNVVQGVENFNTLAFAGTWHEAARFPSALQDGECAAGEYVANDLNSFTVTQTIVNNEREISTEIPVTVAANGVLSVTLPSGLINTIQILDTDYTEFALAYSCRNVNNNQKQIFSWKLSRSRSGFSAAANNRIETVVNNTRDLYEGYYRTTNQSNDACFYYPVFSQNPSSIILPGLCNENIQAVPNFNAADYLGRWIEIARYPQTTQFGACDRAEYSLGNGVVDVSNTQVVNSTLLEQQGFAVVASTDNSGLLDVTFDVNGVVITTNYYVLVTDYINFALVYSCRNLDDGTSQVGSWKLSRTTSLTDEANNIMDNVIANTWGLLEDYYIPTGQSDDDCFYIPEVNPNSAPLFRGQCENVVGVQNFDAQRYQGWWHEIERFPSDGNVGECISSQYTASGNTYEVVDTSVSDGSAQVVTGTVQVSNDGRLTRTLSNGQTQEVWVLATDYDNYALLYSCENVGDEYRRVWSAKHSKTRQLTQAAQTAMAPLIEANRVLYNQFYLPVDQTDSACFHYPEQNGQQVILPGQCDENIPVVQNFDTSAYGGTWYQIERYDQIHESGTCIGARYTLDEERGLVEVLNWEVIDGVLETINGTATVSSNDGSAKLEVILPVIGTDDTVTTPLYVLITDYESYSLAYSCVNINPFQRSVGAWKLSRARTMSNEGTAAVNAYIAQREELHQPYFKQIEHDEECEEPSSALLVKSSIIVMLMCVALQLLM